jgi:hypothetical protein
VIHPTPTLLALLPLIELCTLLLKLGVRSTEVFSLLISSGFCVLAVAGSFARQLETRPCGRQRQWMPSPWHHLLAPNELRVYDPKKKKHWRHHWMAATKDRPRERLTVCSCCTCSNQFARPTSASPHTPPIRLVGLHSNGEYLTP